MTTISWLVLFREIIVVLRIVCSLTHKMWSTFEVLNIKVDGEYTYRSALKLYILNCTVP